MRLFIAIDIEPGVLNRLDKLQKEMRGQLETFRGINWVKPELIHLTLKFLGDVNDDKICELSELVGQVAGRHSGFNVEVRGLGWFGSTARLLWLGTDEPRELLDLQKDLENALMAGEWIGGGKKFSAHLTLCRIKNSESGRAVMKVAGEHENVEMGRFFADSVRIYKSELTSEGPEYTLISTNKLS
jgi:RNA 2',3'-cyclic 3'-phosphodiesterase